MYNDNRDLEWELTLPNALNRLSVKKAIQFILSKIKLPKKAKILDIGVRDGYSLDCWEKQGYKNVLGTELVQLFVDYAKKKRRNAVFDDIVNTKIKGVFDLVYSRHSLEHIRHTVKAINNMVALLKEGGYLVIIVPVETRAKFKEKRPRQKHLNYFSSTKHFKRKTINNFGLEEVLCVRSDDVGLKPKRDIVYIGRKPCTK